MTVLVLDTNTFVAAGFNRNSYSARIVDMVTEGEYDMAWHEQTLQETKTVLETIPPLSWAAVADLFRPQHQYNGKIDLDQYDFVPDVSDRKFIALASAANAVLITADQHLLGQRHQADVTVLSPGEFLAHRK